MTRLGYDLIINLSLINGLQDQFSLPSYSAIKTQYSSLVLPIKKQIEDANKFIAINTVTTA